MSPASPLGRHLDPLPAVGLPRVGSLADLRGIHVPQRDADEVTVLGWWRGPRRLAGVRVRPQDRRIVGSAGLAVRLLTLVGVGVAVGAVVDGHLGAVAAGIVCTLVFGGIWVISPFHLDTDGIGGWRLPGSSTPRHLPWGRVRRISVHRPGPHAGYVVFVELGPGSRNRGPHSTFLAGAGSLGLLARPLRILATAAVVGVLPPRIPVVVQLDPAAPASRSALAVLHRHHPNVRRDSPDSA